MNQKIISYLDKLFKLNVALFPYVVSLSIVLLLIETFTYKGFVSNYLFFPVEMWMIMGLLSGFISVLTSLAVPKVPINTSLYKLLKFILPILSIFMVLVYLLLILIFSRGEETINYGGKFLIYPDIFIYSIILAVFFTVVTNLIYKIKVDTEFSNILYNIKNFSPRVILCIFVSILIIVMLLKSSLLSNLTLFTYNTKNIIKRPLASYSEKMVSQIGPIYNYYQFVNMNTPESAVILHPTQQGQWPDVSNAGYTRYFIYPRNLIAEEELEARAHEVTHVFVIGERKLHNNEIHNRWPGFYVPAERVIYYQQGTDEVVIVEGDYNPEDLKNNADLWGIIEVKKDTTWY